VIANEGSAADLAVERDDKTRERAIAPTVAVPASKKCRLFIMVLFSPFEQLGIKEPLELNPSKNSIDQPTEADLIYRLKIAEVNAVASLEG